MFQWLLNIIQWFYRAFSVIEFQGRSIFAWGIVVFVLGLVIRFVIPLIHMPSSDIMTASIRSSRRHSGENRSVPRNKMVQDKRSYQSWADRRK